MKYWRRIAIFTLKDEKGRFLLLLRDKNVKDLTHYWAFIGGGIEEGETPEEAVMREAEEEIGIRPNLRSFKEYDDLHYKDNLYQAFVFIGKLEHPLEQLKKQQTEGEDLGLFSIDEIKKLKIHDGDMTVWKDIFKNEEEE
ncbi:MAG: NUDIX hydrolase [Candidatus Woesearchaeota archaeon]|nr:MAG: NUDIX hydrolase [Candidatus Woesearchaeota archaeon]